jgi:hydroxyacylglutathione hydrolase
VLICSTGHRSSLAASLLAQRGFDDLYNVAGGMTGYSAARYTGECPVCVLPHGPRVSGAKQPTPKRAEKK